MKLSITLETESGGVVHINGSDLTQLEVNSIYNILASHDLSERIVHASEAEYHVVTA